MEEVTATVMVTDNNITDELPSRPEYMLTTVDNPFDPWSQWDEWYAWDQNAGYNTPGLLARVARLGDDLAEADQQIAIQWAIEEIVRENVSGMHRRVKQQEGKSA